MDRLPSAWLRGANLKWMLCHMDFMYVRIVNGYKQNSKRVETHYLVFFPFVSNISLEKPCAWFGEQYNYIATGVAMYAETRNQLQTFTCMQVSGASAVASTKFSKIKISWVFQKPRIRPHKIIISFSSLPASPFSYPHQSFLWLLLQLFYIYFCSLPGKIKINIL